MFGKIHSEINILKVNIDIQSDLEDSMCSSEDEVVMFDADSM